MFSKFQDSYSKKTIGASLVFRNCEKVSRDEPHTCTAVSTKDKNLNFLDNALNVLEKMPKVLKLLTFKLNLAFNGSKCLNESNSNGMGDSHVDAGSNGDNSGRSKDQSDPSGSDENIASGSDENIASGSDKNISSGSDGNLATGSDENIASGSGENIASGSGENIASRSDENIESRSSKNTAPISLQRQGSLFSVVLMIAIIIHYAEF